MNNIINKKVEKIRDTVKARFTPAFAEEIFGIIVKVNKANNGDLETWNIYDKNSGELLLPNLNSWKVDSLFERLAFDISEMLREGAQTDNNSAGINAAVEELKVEQKKYEEKYYRICPQCGVRYNSQYQTHSHF